DVVGDLLAGFPSPLGLGALIVIALAAHPFALKEHATVGLLDDFDIDGYLESPSSRHRLRGIRAHCYGDVSVICADHTTNDGIGATFRGVANTKSPLQLTAHRVEKLALHFGRSGLIVEREDGHRTNVRRQPTAGETVPDAAACDQQAEKYARKGPKSKLQKAEPLVRA